MKHPIVKVLAVTGILFVGVVIVLIVYITIAKPFAIDPQNTPSAISQPQSSGETTTSSNPLLTPEQETALQNLGVDTSALPTTISPAQMDCAIAALGEARVQELVTGAQLTLMDVYKAKGCL